MSQSSRAGRSIARRACDLCRDRRVQCSFAEGRPDTCRRCFEAGAPCTFLTPTKPRGPPSRRVAEARLRAAASTPPQPHQPPGLPPTLSLGTVTIHDFLPELTFNAVLDDFFLRVYPVLPIVHIPSFNRSRAQGLYNSDPCFLRLCLALCAVTVASIPRNVASGELKYGGEWYSSAVDMVNRASHLVIMSRLSTDPDWQDKASVDGMVVSVVLSMASHYVGKANMGWSYASEAIHFFRELELYKADAYRHLSVWEAEICKRSFWLLFIIQVHDRISFTIPHTGLSYDPQQTDWEFLMPLEIHDEEMDTLGDRPLSPSTVEPTPLISGFIALIKVFVCIVDLLDKTFPGPPQYFSMSHGGVATTLLGPSAATSPSPDLPQLQVLMQVMTRLDDILSNLPAPIRLPQRGGYDHLRDGNQPENSSPHFEIMRANIHITAIYFQSLILEICLNKLANETSSPSDVALRDGDLVSRQLWQMKESVARELLDIINCSSPIVIESNGSSMIKKIREIAATFLDEANDLRSGDPADDESLRRNEYIRKFVEILADLDYIQQ